MAGEDQERFEDYLELERYIEELQAGHVAHPPKDMTPGQASIYRMAALFRSASPDAAGPRPEFAEQLKAQLLAHQPKDVMEMPTLPLQAVIQNTLRERLGEEETQKIPIETPAPKPKSVRFVSRRMLLTGGAAAAASLVVGAGAERLLEQTSQTPITGDRDDKTTPTPQSSDGGLATIALDGETTWLPVTTVAALGNSPVPFNSGAIVGYVIRNKQATTPSDQIIAMSAACTHMGCIVQWQDAGRHFLCPCHEAMFTADGQGVNNSGYRFYLTPLPRLNTKIGEDGVISVEVPKKKK